MKRIILFLPRRLAKMDCYKDVGMFLYSLANQFGWEATLAVLGDFQHNESFEKYCKIISIGDMKNTEDERIEVINGFIKHNIENYDVAVFFNYGSKNYRFAYLCKKYNPEIKVVCKLDMSDDGFSHFDEKTFLRKVKNRFERLKASYVDLFTVETKYYYEKLKETQMFKGDRIQYLPNGVSLLDVDINKLDAVNKENIVLTVGSLGIYEKNNELLLKAIEKLDIDLIKKNEWKFILVGPMEESFQNYVDGFFTRNPLLKDFVIFPGPIYDRTELYSYMARAKIICMTSRSESSCIANVESMFFGCIPLVTDYGKCLIDQTDNKKLGTIIVNDGLDELVSALENYLVNPDSLVTISEECRNYARENFGYDMLGEKINGYLQGLR